MAHFDKTKFKPNVEQLIFRSSQANDKSDESDADLVTFNIPTPSVNAPVPDDHDDEQPGKSALELVIESLIEKIDNMEKEYKTLANQLLTEQQNNSKDNQNETKAQMAKLKQTIKLDRQKTIRLVRKSMQRGKNPFWNRIVQDEFAKPEYKGTYF